MNDIYRLANLYQQILFEFSEGAILKIIQKFSNEASEEKIRAEVNDFERYKNSIQQKDPFQYKNWIEFTEAIHAAKSKAEWKKRGKSPEVSEDYKDEAIIDDSNVTIYKGNDEKRCIKYGKGYPFCISRPMGGNMFGTYRISKASTFYFVFFKNKSVNNADHMVVIDHNENGFEWTFKDNNTKPTTWNKIVSKYPELRQYKNVFVNDPLTSAEKKQLKDIEEFASNQTVAAFNQFNYDTKIKAVTTGEMLIDEIFKILDSNLRNEYISTGSNLTDYQADSLTPSEIQRYNVRRELTYNQLLGGDDEDDDGNYNYLKINKHDISSGRTERSHQAAYKKVLEMAKKYTGGDFIIDVKGLRVLPDLSQLDITGSFICAKNSLTSLKGSPQSVGSFYCYGNQIPTLEGAPQIVRGDFYCGENKLSDLKGGPQTVGGTYDCYGNQLTSLEGVPQTIKGDFNCGGNKLTSLKGGPLAVGRGYYCHINSLVSLEGIPQIITGSVYVRENKLTSLKGAPRAVGNVFSCSKNNLTTLSGAPQSVGLYFDCSNNNLTTLEGAPQAVGGDFICSGNPLKTYKGAPTKIGRQFTGAVGISPDFKPEEFSQETEKWGEQLPKKLREMLQLQPALSESTNMTFIKFYNKRMSK